MTRLTVERLFDSQSLSGTLPSNVRFSPDGASVAYLSNPPDDRNRLDLHCYDIATRATRRWIDASRIDAVGEATAAEKAERERRRMFSTGVTNYRWLPDARRVCCAIDGALYLFDSGNGELRPITPSGARQTDLTVSGGGRHLSYVRAGDLYAYDIDRGIEERLTTDAGDGVTNGLAEFIAQEEMHRFEGHWWSSNGDYLVFTRVDESVIPTTDRYEFTAAALIAYPQRYPYAGGTNARVELGVLNLATRSIRWVEWQRAPDDYLARVTVGADRFVVQAQRRDQRELTVTEYRFDTLESRELLTERHPTWINLHNNLRFVVSDDAFLWTSEREGSSQLYLHRPGHAPLRLSAGQGRVNEVVHADATHAWFTGWIERPTEQHLFRVAYDAPGRVERLTAAPGWHEATVDPTGRTFLDRYSNVEQPSCLQLCAVGRLDTYALSPNKIEKGHPYFEFWPDHAVPEFGRISAADGQELWFRLTRPKRVEHPMPVLVNVYGGPGVQRVRDEWAPLTNQLFVDAGIAVFELDNRGGGNRQKAFEDPLYGRLGSIEVADQLAGIDYLKQQPWVDRNRIGVIGHSYGGFMTLMLLAHNGGDIRAGVSTAPVTDWRLYDTHYTERYLATPQTNAEGYRESCVLDLVDRLRGKLLLMHGMADDNVLFAHSSALMQALQARHFAFELMLYPGSKHALQERDVSIHRYRTILDFLRRELQS